MSGIYQCCYTNAQIDLDGVTTPGWQAVAASPDIPAAAYEACSRLQSIDSSMNGPMTDERGGVLNLLEVQGDDTYLYFVRTQYGLLDRVGRANMFSHGFVMPWGYEDALRDPNAFLTIGDESFKTDTASAQGANERLKRLVPFDLEETLAALDIDNDEYLTLIQCVYAKMTERFITSPLYVQYGGTGEELRGILYCIYLGLPYHLRKQFSAASCDTPNMGNKTVIFSVRATEHQFYIVPGTAENNVITNRLARKISRVGFADYAVRRHGLMDANRYFDALERAALDLGDDKASNPLALKVAHQMVTSPDVSTYSDELLEMTASDALLTGLMGLEGMERRIAQLLGALYERDLDLTDEAEVYLKDWLASPTTRELADAGERYFVNRFSRMPEEDAAAKLDQMRGDSFDRYVMRLAETERGCRILDLYFSNYVVPDASSSWDALEKVLDDSSCVANRPRTEEAVKAAAWKRYTSALDDVHSVRAAYQSYGHVMERLLVAEDMKTSQHEALVEFWHHVTYENFDFESEQLYRDLSIPGHECGRMLALFDLRDILVPGTSSADTMRRESRDEVGNLLKAISTYMDNYLTDDPGERSALRELLIRMATQTYAGEDPYYLDWVNVLMCLSPDADPIIVSKLRQYVYLALNNRKVPYDAFAACYESVRRALVEGETSQDASTVHNLVRDAVSTLDVNATDGDYVPLDLWIAVGSVFYDNPFELFNERAPMLLSVNPVDVARDSSYLRSAEGKQMALAYTKRRDSVEGKTVKAWLKVLRKPQRQRNDPGGGFLGGLFGRRDSLESAPQARVSDTRPSGRQNGGGRHGKRSQGKRSSSR